MKKFKICHDNSVGRVFDSYSKCGRFDPCSWYQDRKSVENRTLFKKILIWTDIKGYDGLTFNKYASVAQLVERVTEDHEVAGSTPSLGHHPY